MYHLFTQILSNTRAIHKNSFEKKEKKEGNTVEIKQQHMITVFLRNFICNR